jgi:large subunit ribosomal protein L9
MKIILLTDIPGLGRKNDIKDLKPGFARNFLLQKKAIIATPQAINAAATQEKKRHDERALHDTLLKKTIAEINGKAITIQEKGSEGGHLYQGIGKQRVLETIKTTLGITLPENALMYEKPLKEKGDHPLPLIFNGKPVGSITLSIEIL